MFVVNVFMLNKSFVICQCLENILRMASYFEPYIMHFVEINYMSCIPWLINVMYSMEKTCLYMYKTKYLVIIESCALI